MPGAPGVGSDGVSLLKQKLVLDSIFSSLFQHIALTVRNSFRTEPSHPLKQNEIQADDLKGKKHIGYRQCHVASSSLCTCENESSIYFFFLEK